MKAIRKITPSWTETFYCLCGEVFTVTGRAEGIYVAVELWSQNHQGWGHGLTDKQTCERNRERARQCPAEWRSGQPSLFPEQEDTQP